MDPSLPVDPPLLFPRTMRGYLLGLPLDMECEAEYSEQHATVKADVVDVESGEELTTNKFRFTWCDDHGPRLGRRVVPKTYQGMHVSSHMQGRVL